MSTDQLRDALGAHLDRAAVPPGDLPRAMREGRSRRRRRRGIAAGMTAVATAGVVGAVLALGPGTPDDRGGADVATVPSVGALDASEGLRAFTAPGEPVHLGGRTFDVGDLPGLDTTAAVTPDGVVFFDEGRPFRLGLDGRTEPLFDGEVTDDPGFRPSVAADTEGDVALSLMTGGETVVLVVAPDGSLVAGPVRVPCLSRCGEVEIDAFDDGVVYAHAGREALYLRTAEERWTSLPRSVGPRVLDVRGGVALVDGGAPSALLEVRELDTVIEGAPGQRLTLDGAHVLGASPVLQPTGGLRADPIRLDLPGGRPGLGFYALDTDGSVLAAVTDAYPDFTVYDCGLDGTCEEIGTLAQGDPIFPGTDG